jgi:HK97 gp10 family phage protein
MLSITFDADKLENTLNLLSKKALEGFDVALKRGALTIQRQAKKVHNYKRRTGDLDKSIQRNSKKLKHEVGFNESVAIYGKFQHDGTRSIKQDLFIPKAWESQKDAILSGIRKDLRKYISNAN